MHESDQQIDLPDRKPNSGRGKVVFGLAALIVCSAAIFVYLLEPKEQTLFLQDPLPKAIVSVVDIPAQQKHAVVRTFAQVRPMWSADLRASHSARILSVSDRALAGRRIEKGDVLIELETAALLSELRSAELALVEAEVDLMDARGQTDLRRRQAARLGNEELTEFALLLPELRVAENAIISAEARVNAAEVAVENATVRAPFDGFVTTRSVSPGQSVSAGDTLVSVVNGNAFEIEAGLSAAQWRLLEHPINNMQAEVRAMDGTVLGLAEVRDAGGFRDEETREFKVFLEINRDQDRNVDVQLISGALVDVTFDGRSFAETLAIPESSLTREGDVWYVDDQERLQRFQPDVLWRENGSLVIAKPAEQKRYRISTAPLAGFLTGAEVSPVFEEQP